MNGSSMSDDAYVQALEKQCADWERMYKDLKSECDQLRKQLEIARHPSAMAQKKHTAQIRHV